MASVFKGNIAVGDPFAEGLCRIERIVKSTDQYVARTCAVLIMSLLFVDASHCERGPLYDYL